ncbi:UNKNOWN [Stylonychia lemnae]|uniref:Uncharacterized protein n=1 Tax=Stylonychia lemnae TaxID=5949 RepID=A0A077ZUM5_STYLE|nr:UNKNOWN [Stylonychia lemnae]|eukprot:CDW73603.1 UNKNOWN [Stylonychia lemnae]
MAIALQQDLLFSNWFYLNPKTIDFEIDSVLWRNQVEEKYFNFKLENINDLDTKERLKDVEYYNNKGSQFTMKQYKLSLNKKVKLLADKQLQSQQIDHSTNDFSMLSNNPIDKSDIKDNQTEETFKGRLLLKEIAMFSYAQQPQTLPILFMFTILKLSIPFLLRLKDYGTILGFDNWDNLLCTLGQFSDYAYWIMVGNF